MDNELSPKQRQHQWRFDIGKQILSFVVGVVVAAFVLGSARQKTLDVVAWRSEIAPKIERMDAQGTLSFSHFQTEYIRTQSRQEDFMKELDDRVRELERQNNRPNN